MEWLEGASYRWDLFNHRVSHLHFGVEEGAAQVAVVGGTSTTNLPTELDDGCDQDTCSEFPFFDEADVTVDLVQVRSKKARMASGSVEVVAGADGATSEVVVEFERKAKGDVVAVLRGFTLDTNEPLSGGTACYQPRNGWLPRRISLALGEPVLSDDGKSATVPVEAHFEAGVTFEDERQCLDAVVDQAEVRVRLDVAVVANAPFATHELSQGAEYEYGDGPSKPTEQPDPDPSTRQVDLGDANALGWSKLDYRFHQGQGDTRGAYVRSLAFLGAPDGFATGHATNYSPPTQLSGFDYTFEGTLVALEIPGDVERVSAQDVIDIELDDDGTPVPQEL